MSSKQQVGHSEKSYNRLILALKTRFCDAGELKKSWEHTGIPEFVIPKSHQLKMETIQMSDESDEDRTEVHTDVTEEDEETEWTIRNEHSHLHCFFQMTYYHSHRGRKKYPLFSLLGKVHME